MAIPPPPPGFVDIEEDQEELQAIPPPPPGFVDIDSVPVENTINMNMPPPPPGFVDIKENKDPLLTEPSPFVRGAREVMSFDWMKRGVAKAIGTESLLPPQPGQAEKELGVSTGSEYQLALQNAERSQGEPGVIKGGIQFAANFIGGIASVVGSPVSMVVELGSAAMREVGEATARMFAKQVLGLKDSEEYNEFGQEGGYSAEAAMRRAIQEGHLSWSGQGKRIAIRSTEGFKAMVQSLSPAATAAVVARDGERLQAFKESAYMYPVESALGPLMILKGGGRLGGKARTVSVETGKIAGDSVGPRVGVKNIRGKSKKLNSLGVFMHDWTHHSLRPYLWDTAQPKRIFIDELVHNARTKRGAKTAKALEEYEKMQPKIKEAVGEIRDAAREGGVELSEADVLLALENKVRPAMAGDEPTYMTREVVDSYVAPESVLRDAETIKRTMYQYGVDEPLTDVWMAYLHKSSVDIANTVKRKEGRVLLDKLDMHNIASDVAMYSEMKNKMMGMIKDGTLQGFVDEFLIPRGKDLQNNIFNVAESRMYKYMREAVNDPDAKVRWKPKSTEDLKQTFFDAYGEAKRTARKEANEFAAQMREKALELGEEWSPMKERAAFASKAFAGMQVSDFGAVQRTMPFKTWQQAVGFLSQKDVAGRQMIMAGLMDPWVRITSKADAGPVERIMSTLTQDPNSPINFYRKTIRKLQFDIADGMGVDPVVMASNMDSYISRSFRDMLNSQIYLADELSFEAASAVHKVKSPRFKRKLNSIDSDNWYEALIESGQIDPDIAVGGTVAILSSLADRMSHWAHIHDGLKKAGLLADERPPGKKGAQWVRTPAAREGKRSEAASGDPYNFLFGKLADKWVDPSVARQLKLAKDYWKKSHPAVQLFKLFHTAFNPYGYHVRNELGDTANVWHASGINPLFGAGKKLRGDAVLDMRKFDDTGVMTEHMKEAVSSNVIDMEGGLAILGEPTSVQGRFSRVYKAILDEAYSSDADPVKQNEMVAKTAMHILMTGSVPAGIKGTIKMAKGARPIKLSKALIDVMQDAYREYNREYSKFDPQAPTATVQTFGGAVGRARRIELEQGAGTGTAAWVAGGAALEQLVKRLTDTGMFQWTKWHENKRRLWAYKIARTELKMKAPEAARFVKDTLHDYGDRPRTIAWAQAHPIGQVLLPPFLTYGWKQVGFGARRAFNDPRHYVLGLMTDALQAMEAQRSIDEGSYEDLRNKLQFANLTHYGADNILAGNTGELGDAAKMLNMRREFADVLAGRVRDEFGNVTSSNSMTMVIPIRDMANLNTMLSNFDTQGEAWQIIARTSPFTNAFMTLVDDNAKNYASGKVRDINNEIEGPFDKYAFKMKQLFQIFAPFKAMDRAFTQRGAPELARGIGLATGLWGDDWKPSFDKKTGNPIHMLEALRPFMPASHVVPLDKTHLMLRLASERKAMEFKAQRGKREYLRQFNIFDDEHMPIFERAELNLRYRLQLAALQSYNKMFVNKNARRDYAELKKSYEQAVRELDKTGETSLIKHIPDSLRETVGVMLEAANRAMRGYNDERVSEDSNN